MVQVADKNDVGSFLNKTQEEMRLLFAADGLAVCVDGKIESVGITPTNKQIEGLAKWLELRRFSNSIQFPDLPFHYDPARKFADTATGILFIPLHPARGNYIMAFRAEKIQKVSWGGDPNQVLTFEPGSTKYHPRNSFAIWKETVRFTAEAWSTEDLFIAEKLRMELVETILSKKMAGK